MWLTLYKHRRTPIIYFIDIVTRTRIYYLKRFWKLISFTNNKYHYIEITHTKSIQSICNPSINHIFLRILSMKHISRLHPYVILTKQNPIFSALLCWKKTCKANNKFRAYIKGFIFRLLQSWNRYSWKTLIFISLKIYYRCKRFKWVNWIY